jgi:hypothetical protein
MGAVEAREHQVASASEFRRLLDEALRMVDADQRSGPLIRATGMRMRLEFPDLDLVLNVGPGEEAGSRLGWEFSDHVEWNPRLSLTMDSTVANACLQGKESLAIAIARRRVRLSGEARSALRYVPALRLVGDAYRRVVRAEYPHLALA